MLLTPDSFAAYNALPIGVVMLREDLVIEGWNATIARWSRVASSDAVGRALNDLFPEFDVERFRLRMAAVFENGQSAVLSNAMHQRVLPLQTAYGHPLLHKLHASSAPGNRGRALLVIEDVTTTVDQLNKLREERRRLQASEQSLRDYSDDLRATNAALTEAQRHAEEANLAKSEFLANMSHEIRTPLTAVKGFAEILREHAESPFAEDAAERVVRNGDHLLAIVNDVLDLSKIESGKLTLASEACSPSEVAEDACRMLGTRAEQKGIELITEICPHAPSCLYTDPMRLRQVLVNLVGNALKFTEQGKVCIQVDSATESTDRGMVRFSVSDTGIGVDPAKLEKIFEPFTQEDTSTQRRFGGTGLGLSISRELVTQMGGAITVCSEPGVGSTFSLLLPLGESSQEAVASSRLAKNDTKSFDSDALPLSGRRILIAEDGPDNRRLIEYLLSRAGADLALVDNGQLAVDAMLNSEDESTFDLVVLDMQMPVMDGYTAAAMLRRAGVTQPIIALTAHAMAGDRDKALAAGCNDYATKPIDPTALVGLIAGLTADQPRPLESASC